MYNLWNILLLCQVKSIDRKMHEDDGGNEDEKLCMMVGPIVDKGMS